MGGGGEQDDRSQLDDEWEGPRECCKVGLWLLIKGPEGPEGQKEREKKAGCSDESGMPLSLPTLPTGRLR